MRKEAITDLIVIEMSKVSPILLAFYVYHRPHLFETMEKIAERSRQPARSFFCIHISISMLISLSNFYVSILISPSNVSGYETYSVSHPTTLRLCSGLPVENSPGSKPGALMVCERVHMLGLPRLQNLRKYANSLKVKVNATKTSSRTLQQNVEVCFHRNTSLGIGMCPVGEWEKLLKGSLVRSMSPYSNRLLDIRMPGPSFESIEVSTEEEFLLHRMVFLVLGIVMMTLAPFLSNSIVFYYSSAMAVGVILVLLIVLFQGMKLLPTGRKSSLAIFLYSSIVGVGSFLLSYLSSLLRSLLVQMGVSEDIYSPVAMFLLVCLVLAGAWLGFWGVRKLVLTEDGSVDISIAQFVVWSIRIFAAAMILQSSLDSLLATGALFCGIIFSSMVRSISKSRFIFSSMVRSISKSSSSNVIYLSGLLVFGGVKHVSVRSFPSGRVLRPCEHYGLRFKSGICVNWFILSAHTAFVGIGGYWLGHHLATLKYRLLFSILEHLIHDTSDSEMEYMHEIRGSKSEFRPQSKPSTLASGSSVPGSMKALSPNQPSDADTYYSTFHRNPEKKRFSKEEWENFTKHSTKKALEGLVSSPDFTRWAVAHADRITLTPTDDSTDKMKGLRRRWLHWE